MKFICALILFSYIKCGIGRKNVLFIVSDDMRPDIGVYRNDADATIHTPNLDALAKNSLLLKNAYVQQAFCSPSRTSFLTGRRPDTTHVYDLVRYFRYVGGNFTTIPQYFKLNGYRTVGMGKIFHPGIRASGNDDPISWTEPYFHSEKMEQYETKNRSWRAVPRSEYQNKTLPDTQLADYAIDVLRYIGPASKIEEKPFFMAVGFNKPHLPFVFPEEFLSLYPLKNTEVSDNSYIPENMPYIAWHKYWELLNYQDIKDLKVSGNPNTSFPVKAMRELRRAYYSTISYVDFEIGRIIQELEDLGLANNTVVSFIGDHGYQLGEHGEWCKHTNFEESLRAPMMIRIPGKTDKGIETDKLTEFVDLFPTLVEAAELEPLSLCPHESSQVDICTEGVSMMPLISDPNREWKTAVFSQYPRQPMGRSVMGYSIRTERYRYTEWVGFQYYPNFKPNWNNVYGVELYDLKFDPKQNYNRASDVEYHDDRYLLMQQLHKGWRNCLPSGNF